LYKEESATLRTAAKKLGIPARRLSESVNRVYGESYSRRMNRLRVEEAKRLLRDHPGKAMLEVMYEAGFRTKSSFNKEFRALEGVSPSEYQNGIDG
ncbi:MAG: helix-turn-helix domain-containing protein, partial [Gammaproteobacteria bacterium]|nr:helix-turn-helix domain-containing protein [Gammaproteobacteria bacterium]